jgi:antitoxin PrlF
MFISSQLTQKYQATIPRKIRDLLGLIQGDKISFEIEGDKVIVKKAVPLDFEYAKALENTVVTEWGSAIDDEAFRDL